MLVCPPFILPVDNKGAVPASRPCGLEQSCDQRLNIICVSHDQGLGCFRARVGSFGAVYQDSDNDDTNGSLSDRLLCIKACSLKMANSSIFVWIAQRTRTQVRKISRLLLTFLKDRLRTTTFAFPKNNLHTTFSIRSLAVAENSTPLFFPVRTPDMGHKMRTRKQSPK